MSPPWWRMRLSLDCASPAPCWPDGIRPTAFTPDDARALHATLAGAFVGRPDGPPGFSAWWDGLRTDSDFDPGLCVLATTQADGIAGVCQSWAGGFIKDLAVRSDWRRRGLAEALVLHTVGLFRQRQIAAVELKVLTDNHVAIRLYERLGFARL